MKKGAQYLFLFFALFFLGTGDLLAARKISSTGDTPPSGKAQPVKKTFVEKKTRAAKKASGARKTAAANKASRPLTPEGDKTPPYEEKGAVVKVPSSDVFANSSLESERVTEVLLGDEFIVIREDKEWAYGYIPSQKGYRGWLRKDNIAFSAGNPPPKDQPFIQVKKAKARITFSDGSFLNVYAGTRLPLLNRENGRYEVIVPSGSTGFLPSETAFVENEVPGREVTPEDILQASQFYGPGYKWGGITAGGMDCSGFVYTVFRTNGIYLKRDSYLQAEEGLDVPIDQLKAGDLVFFKSQKTNRITHVGIYIGNGNFIHSSRGKKGVAVSSLSDEAFRKNFAGARRILHLNKTALLEENKEPILRHKNES